MSVLEKKRPDANIAAKVQGLLAEELDLPLDDLSPGRVLEELGVDSLGIVEVMFRMEEEFDIRMGDEQVPLKTVQDVIDLVAAKISARQDQAG